MRFEFSAGGIVYKHEKPQKGTRRTTKVLVAQHSQHHGWVFPKGLIGDKADTNENKKPETTETQKKNEAQKHKLSVSDEFSASVVAGETKEEAALREVREETGVYGKIVKELPPITYWYRFSRKAGSGSARDNEKIKKTVYYFLMEYVAGSIKDHDFEMENVEWLPVDKVEGRLTYKSDKEVWKEAMDILNIKD